MNGVFISIGGFDIRWYSILIVLAFLIGMIIATKESERVSISKNLIIDLCFYIIPISIIGARIYYVIFNYSAFSDDWLEMFRIWHGGLAIYGGIILSVLYIFEYCHSKGQNAIQFLDILAPALILGQAIGRWGNFFNQEAYGPATTLAFLKQLHLPDFIINGMHINGIYYQPTFLYESIWCLIGFLILLIIRKKYRKKIGTVTCSYLIIYGIGRFLIEGLRMDSLFLGAFRISQIVSITALLVGIIGLIIIKPFKKKKEDMIVNVKL